MHSGTTHAKDWLEQTRLLTDQVVGRVSIAESSPWGLDANGVISRDDNRFFSVIGISGSSNKQNRVMIDQPEIGVLGFLIARTPKGVRILVQAKDEPGNLGVTQLAPSVQATQSNYTRAHGGLATPFLSEVLDSKEKLSSALHSEHGNRFWQKRNRNTVSVVDGRLFRESDRYRAFDLSEVLLLAGENNALNTDARSVLACTDWNKLKGNAIPFSSNLTPITARLRSSFEQTDKGIYAEILENLMALRKAQYSEFQKLSLLDSSFSIQLNSSGELLELSDEVGKVFFISVSGGSREVDSWSQPIYEPKNADSQILLCREVSGMLEYLIKPIFEIGLQAGVEYGPSLSSFDDNSNTGTINKELLSLISHSFVHASSMQSDEGGRFWKAECLYQIREVTSTQIGAQLEEALFQAGYRWVSLGVLQKLTAKEMCTTNELRSVLSLYLKYL